MGEPMTTIGKLIRLYQSDGIERLSHLPAVLENMMARMAEHGVIADAVSAKNLPARTTEFRGNTWSFPPSVLIAMEGELTPEKFGDGDHAVNELVRKAANLPGVLRAMTRAMSDEGAWIESVKAVLPGDGTVRVMMQGRRKAVQDAAKEAEAA